MEGRRRINPVVIIAVVWVLIAGAFALSLVIGDDDEPADEASPSGPSGVPAADLPPGCENLHAGHNLAMWNPVMADEMTEAECPWPYDPFLVDSDGGEADDSIDASFEPLRYAELWDMVGQSDLGVCQVAVLSEESGEGFVFGFTYTVSEPGCAEDAPRVDMVVREYVTREWRDAHAGDDASGRRSVLGRWTVDVEGDSTVADALVEGLAGLGADAV